MSTMYKYSEAFIRRLISTYGTRIWNPSDTVKLWEQLPEKQQKKILSNKWIPAGVKPILAATFSFNRCGFVLCDDNVFYSHKADLPERVSIAGLVGCNWLDSLVYADGSEVKIPKLYFCENWLWDFFKAVAENHPGVQRDFAPPAEYDFLKSITEDQWNSVRRDPGFLTAEEMPEYLIAKLHRAFPEVKLEQVRGFCDLPESRKHCIVITKDAVFYNGDYGRGHVDLNLWNSNFYTDPDSGKMCFRHGKGQEVDEKEDHVVSVGDRVFRRVEELVEYQYAKVYYDAYFRARKTERISREKAKFVYTVRRLLWEQTWNRPLDEAEKSTRMQLFQIAMDGVLGYFEDMVVGYERLHRSLSPKTDLRLWAYTGFMCEFYKPLSVSSVKWMLYYLIQLERNCIITYRYFFSHDEKWDMYFYSDRRWQTSLITLRNELAQRFNAQAEADGQSPVPILEGYVLDDCLERGQKKY